MLVPILAYIFIWAKTLFHWMKPGKQYLWCEWIWYWSKILSLVNYRILYYQWGLLAKKQIYKFSIHLLTLHNRISWLNKRRQFVSIQISEKGNQVSSWLAQGNPIFRCTPVIQAIRELHLKETMWTHWLRWKAALQLELD